ncbi:hypothetical protein N9R79_12560 [Vibrio sp.]|nr:hypothetical protein [Vibrio sp.]
MTERIEIEGQGVSRDVSIFNAVTHQYLGMAQSDFNGELTFDVDDNIESVLILAQDEDGSRFIGGFSYRVGDRIKISSTNAFRYEVFIAGVSSDSAPHWPLTDGELVQSGNAIFKAVRYYRPIAKFVPL